MVITFIIDTACNVLDRHFPTFKEITPRSDEIKTCKFFIKLSLCRLLHVAFPDTTSKDVIAFFNLGGAVQPRTYEGKCKNHPIDHIRQGRKDVKRMR